MGDLQRGLAGLRDSREAYETAGAYYVGKIGEVFMTQEIAKLIETIGDHFRLNFASAPVDKLMRRCKLASVVVEGDDAASQRLQVHLDVNDFENMSKLANLKAGMYGDAYVFVWPNAKIDGRVDAFYNSPLAVRLMYSAENPRDAEFAIKLWKSDKRYRANLIYADHIERYVTTTEIAGKEDDGALCYVESSFERFVPEGGTEADSDVANPFGVLPVFHFKHGGDQYGEPAHLKAYGPQDAISKIIATQMSTFEATGFPVRYALENDSNEGDADGGEDWSGDGDDNLDDDERISDRRNKSRLKNAPGTMQILAGIKSVGQFDAPSPDNFLKPASFYIEALAMLTDTPLEEVYSGGTPPSGESRRQSKEAINSHARDYMDQNTRRWEEVAEAIAEMAGLGTIKAKAAWAPVDRTTDKDGWEVIGAKIENGVPLRVALEEAGYDAAEIEEWYPDGAPAYSSAELVRVAASLASLGQAMTLGAIAPAQVTALFPQIFEGAQIEGERIPMVLPGGIAIPSDVAA